MARRIIKKIRTGMYSKPKLVEVVVEDDEEVTKETKTKKIKEEVVEVKKEKPKTTPKKKSKKTKDDDKKEEVEVLVEDKTEEIVEVSKTPNVATLRAIREIEKMEEEISEETEGLDETIVQE